MLLRSLLLTSCCLVSVVCTQRVERAESVLSPNLVLIIADDMSWNDSGAYGNPAVHTPDIDRLAGEGMGFDRAYLTASSCSPSRSSIITGRYPHATNPGPTFQGVSFTPVLRDPASMVREHAFAEDHWHDYEDHGRAVTDGRYKLIRNDYFDLPGTPPADAGRSPTFQVMRRLRDQGRLSAAQRAVFAQPLPQYELYDLASDPDELENLAEDPASRPTRRRLEAALAEWAEDTDDAIPPVRTPDEFDRETGQPTAARVRPRPSKAEMFPAGR